MPSWHVDHLKITQGQLYLYLYLYFMKCSDHDNSTITLYMDNITQDETYFGLQHDDLKHKIGGKNMHVTF